MLKTPFSTSHYSFNINKENYSMHFLIKLFLDTPTIKNRRKYLFLLLRNSYLFIKKTRVFSRPFAYIVFMTHLQSSLNIDIYVSDFMPHVHVEINTSQYRLI